MCERLAKNVLPAKRLPGTTDVKSKGPRGHLDVLLVTMEIIGHWLMILKKYSLCLQEIHPIVFDIPFLTSRISNPFIWRQTECTCGE